MFFLELCDYYGRENNDEKELLRLLYQSLKALQHPSLPGQLVQYIFEVRALVIHGEYPGIPRKLFLQESTKYALDFIVTTPVEKLYTFNVSKEVLWELKTVTDELRKKYIDRKIKSLEMITLLEA